MEWSNEYNVDVPALDNQHKKLFSLIDKLDKAMHEGKGSSVLSPILSELTTYTVTHFKDEEILLERNNYPKLQIQIAEHKIFVDKLNAFKNDLDHKKVGLSIEVANYLRTWLKNHILQKDKEYSTHLKNFGIK